MIDHIGLDVTNIARSKAFYAAALAPLGYRVVAEETDGGSTVVMFGVEGPSSSSPTRTGPARRTMSPSAPTREIRSTTFTRPP